MNAEARPADSGIVLKQEFRAAVKKLKKTRLGGKKGAAMKSLPWYLVVGPGDGGKTTALVQLGLESLGGRVDAIDKVEPTPLCEWWYSDTALFLDTAGRYGSDASEEKEWKSLLRFVRKYRRDRPLNGIVVALNLAEVLISDEEKKAQLAKVLRNRIDQAVSETGLALPVYILFTKCDRLTGFNDYFGDLKAEGRDEILGFTFGLELGKEDIEKSLDMEFKHLNEELRTRGLRRLAGTKWGQFLPTLQFPLQFESASLYLKPFVNQIFAPSTFQEAPPLRGVYFCSGAQTGYQLQGLAQAALGITEYPMQPEPQPETGHAFFMNELVEEVIVPDQYVAKASNDRTRRRQLMLSAFLIFSMVCSAFLLGVGLVTFTNNYSLVSSTVDMAKVARTYQPDDPKAVLENFKLLERYGKRLDALEHARKEGPAWSLGFGYYQGGHLKRQAEAIYGFYLMRSFVNAAGGEMNATLADISEAATLDRNRDPGLEYNLLKTYLMVTNPKYINAKFGAKVLVPQWQKRLHPEVAPEVALLTGLAERYLRLRKADPENISWLPREDKLVEKARIALEERDVEYRRFVAEGNKQLAPFSVVRTLPAIVAQSVESKVLVPGIYSHRGWKEHIRDRISPKALKDAGWEPWVMSEEGGMPDLANRLCSRYFHEYTVHWEKFLGGLGVARAKNIDAALRVLDRLTGEPSPHRSLFGAVLENTMISSKPCQEVLIDEKGGKSMSQVAHSFSDLKAFVSAPTGGLKAYLQSLVGLKDALNEQLEHPSRGRKKALLSALSNSKGSSQATLAGLPENLRRVLKKLITGPVTNVSETL